MRIYTRPHAHTFFSLSSARNAANRIANRAIVDFYWGIMSSYNPRNNCKPRIGNGLFMLIRLLAGVRDDITLAGRRKTFVITLERHRHLDSSSWPGETKKKSSMERWNFALDSHLELLFLSFSLSFSKFLLSLFSLDSFFFSIFLILLKDK